MIWSLTALAKISRWGIVTRSLALSLLTYELESDLIKRWRADLFILSVISPSVIPGSLSYKDSYSKGLPYASDKSLPVRMLEGLTILAISTHLILCHYRVA